MLLHTWYDNNNNGGGGWDGGGGDGDEDGIVDYVLSGVGDSDGGTNYGDCENDSSADILKWNGMTKTHKHTNVTLMWSVELISSRSKYKNRSTKSDNSNSDTQKETV